MKGYRTLAGLILIIVGWLGLGEFVTEAQIGEFVDLAVQLVGILVAIYGNYKAHREIKALGGYRY